MTNDEHYEWLAEHLHVLRIEPGDVLVFSHPGRLSDVARDAITGKTVRAFPGHYVMLLEEGMQLGVVREGGK